VLVGRTILALKLHYILQDVYRLVFGTVVTVEACARSLNLVAGKEGKAMVEILGIVVFVILLTPIFKDQKYKEMERQKDMRRAIMKLQDKYRHNSL